MWAGKWFTRMNALEYFCRIFFSLSGIQEDICCMSFFYGFDVVMIPQHVRLATGHEIPWLSIPYFALQQNDARTEWRTEFDNENNSQNLTFLFSCILSISCHSGVWAVIIMVKKNWQQNSRAEIPLFILKAGIQPPVSQINTVWHREYEIHFLAQLSDAGRFSSRGIIIKVNVENIVFSFLEW